jgi:hypothetical protein
MRLGRMDMRLGRMDMRLGRINIYSVGNTGNPITAIVNLNANFCQN